MERLKLPSRNKKFCRNSALDWRSSNLSTSEILPLKAGNYDKLIHLLFFFFEPSCSFPYMLIVPTTVVGDAVVAAGSNGDLMHLGFSISQQKLLCWMWLVHCKTVPGLLIPLFPLLLPHQLTAFSAQIQTGNRRHQFHFIHTLAECVICARECPCPCRGIADMFTLWALPKRKRTDETRDNWGFELRGYECQWREMRKFMKCCDRKALLNLVLDTLCYAWVASILSR